MIKGHKHWLIQDAKGKIWRLMMDTLEYSEVMHFHAGIIADMTLSTKQNVATTVGSDGQVKLWDYLRDKEHYSRRFLGKGTCIDSMPHAEANQGRVVSVGFDNGIVRTLLMGNQNFQILKAFKAHDKSIKKVKYAPDGSMLVTCDSGREIFFFETSAYEDVQKCTPLCLIELPEDAVINDLTWDANSQNVLIGCKNGHVYELRRPNPREIDNTETYLLDQVPLRDWKIKMMEFQMKKNQKKSEEEEEKKRRMRLRGELPKEEEEEDEDWDPEPILSIAYAPDSSGRFYVTSQGLFQGYMYLSDFSQERPLKAVPIGRGALTRITQPSPSGDMLITAMDNGEIEIRHQDNLDKYMQIQMHDAHGGSIRSVQLTPDEKFVLSVAEDGLMIVHQIDKENIRHESTFEPLEDVEGVDYMAQEQVDEIRERKVKEFFEEHPVSIMPVNIEAQALNSQNLQQSVRLTDEVNEDITDPSIYSI